MDVLEKAFKELQKQIQKSAVMKVAIEKTTISTQNKIQIEESSQKEIEVAKERLSNSSNGLSHAIKGEFSKKISKIVDRQKRMFDVLK